MFRDSSFVLFRASPRISDLKRGRRLDIYAASSFGFRHWKAVIMLGTSARVAGEKKRGQVEGTVYHRPMLCRVLSGLGSILPNAWHVTMRRAR